MKKSPPIQEGGGEPLGTPLAFPVSAAESESSAAAPQGFDLAREEHDNGLALRRDEEAEAEIDSSRSGLGPLSEHGEAQVEHSTGVSPSPEREIEPSVKPVEASPMAPPPPAGDDAAAGAADASAAATQAAPDATAAEPTSIDHAIGVLVVNLGTPDAPEPASVRRYLKEFLTDRRVIEKDSLLWKAVLNGVILPLRSRRRAHDYKNIWNNEKNESPLKTITRAQAEKLAGALDPLAKHVIVDWAMRYAGPAIGARLEALIKRGCDRILIMPLYPQYAAAATATACDEVFKFMTGLRRQPALRILPAYYDDPCYIEALASALRSDLRALPFEPEVILASYHGLPKEYVAKGDPYETQCVWTTQLLREQLELDETKFMMSFQSRFGRSQWLEPYTIETVKTLAKKGVKNLAVMTPGFAADCLETLEEIAIDNARVFKRHGGKNFAAIPCLNDSEVGMLMLRQLAMRELKGWI